MSMTESRYRKRLPSLALFPVFSEAEMLSYLYVKLIQAPGRFWFANFCFISHDNIYVQG